ncbi:MAG TPA: DUF2935 domain-containing protein [Epulopiscium sp.]|nr:DUF2935 domain-containing protein [Candidatus Epulonipiscium sp.]
MLSNSEVIKQSLALHLFFARIMKEHAFFLVTGFTPKDQSLIQQANSYQMKFDKILIETISLSSGVVNPKVLESGEVITPFTLKAEMSSAYFTGVNINTNLTQAEIGLKGSCSDVCTPGLENKIKMLNNNVINLLMSFINFKDKVLSDVLSCGIFTRNYPALLEHIISEAKFYLGMIQKIQKCEKIVSDQQAYALEAFWDHIMEEHATIMSVLLDPSEKQLIAGAQSFEKEFKTLSKDVKEKEMQSGSLVKTTCQTIIVTKEIGNFKRQATQDILECKIKSVIIPLLADHVLREANHYLRILKEI